MASLKEVRTRIASVDSTKQITSAMKMVSASKLRKTQNSIIKLKPYAKKMNEILQNLCAVTENNNELFIERKEINNILIISIASNRGLCGTFNTSIIKATQNFINENFSQNFNDINLMCIGRKVSEFFEKRKYNIDSIHNELLENLNYDKVAELSDIIIKKYIDKKYDKVFVVYNYFKNVASQEVKISQFLPFIPVFKENINLNSDYILEPNKKYVLEEIIPRTLKLNFYNYILNSFVSEHGARMTAMHKATDNATELLKELKLTYNKVRQASITGEILEIVGGADALQ